MNRQTGILVLSRLIIILCTTAILLYTDTGDKIMQLEARLKDASGPERVGLLIELADTHKELAAQYEKKKNYKLAIHHYRKFKEINDSILQENSRKKIAELQTGYEIEKKEKELDLLKKDKEIRQLDLSRQKNIKKSFIIISMLVFILALVTYLRYRYKSRLTGVLKQEIQEHRKTGRKLRESEEKFRVLAEKSVVGIGIIQDDTIRYVNPRFLSIFGYTREEIMEKNPLTLVHPEDRSIFEINIKQRLAGSGDSLHFEFRGTSRDGEVIYLESYGTLTHYEGREALLETVIDITDRKQAESELLKTRKLESVGILAGGIANDFNRLLSIITENLSTAIEETRDLPPALKMLESAGKASQQARELAKKLMTFSEGGWIIAQKVKFSTLLQNTLNYHPEMKSLIKSISIPDELKPIHVDERQLRQVLFNILQNAGEAMSGGDTAEGVVIETRDFVPEPGNSQALKDGEYVNVRITDNGRGIPREHMEKIFDPYFSTKDDVTQKGMGLGLALCYSIIKKHNGHITVKSVEGKGTTVELFLPVYRKTP